ncbi:unnamed protein product [Orchesella dallaii]|uniref:Uncharacterized protein n=1 Tax=Orchesella dallaii TaxID=48710 RepID=A0ABP1QQ82_9HEXA
MPGAGFLEMCLTGGHCSVQGFTEDLLKPRRPIILKSLKIALPLALYDSEPCQLQTVIFLDDKEEKEIGYSVNVYRQNDADGSGTGQWISHASATFLPVAPASIPELSLKINIPEIINSWPKSDSKDFYEKLPEVGLRFGPKFQCLEAAWKSENSILLKVKVPEDHAAYLIHPIVADAMIQAIMLWTSKEGIKKKLQVPVQVGQFIWVASFDDPSNVYGYCANNEEGKPFCSLVDGNGTCLALMSEVDFIETTVKLVEGMIQQQSVAMPKLWEDVWKNAPGPLQNSFPLAEIDPKVPSEEEEQKLKELNDIGEDERRVHENMDALTRAYFLDALYQLGWNPQPDLPFTIDDLMSILLIGVAYKKFVEFFMRNLAEKGILEETKYGFCWKEQIPNNATLFDEIKKRTLTKDFNRLEYKLLVEIGKSLADILRGKVEPLQILFPEDSSKPSAFHFYDSRRPFTSRVIQFSLKAFIVEYVSKSSELFRNSKKPGKPVFRVLEIGAGTGTASQYFVQSIDEIGWDFEYYYTDLSAVFFNSAAEKLHKFSRNIIFKKYNMDEDPLHQGLCPQYFDLIIALEAVHVAKDLRKTLKYIRSILKPGGVFQIVESITPDPIVTFLFGVLPGYWQNEDTDFRPNHITLTGERWKEVLTETKFKNIIISPSYDSVHGVIQCNATLDEDILSGIHKAKYSWIIFDNKSELCELLKRKLTLLNRDVMIIQPFEDEEWTEASVKASMNKFIHLATTDEKILEGIIYLWSLVDDATLRDQRKLSLPFISLCQRLTELVNPPRVYAITRGACNATDTELINPNPCTILGILKSLGNEQGALKLNHLDLDPSQPIVEQATHIYFSLWQETPDFICLRGEKRVASRLTSVKIQKDDLNIPNGCDRFQLLLPKTRLISDLEFGFLDHYELAENEVEVQIKTMALNFRDVFAVLKPIADFETFNAVGLDWAGVVTKVGSGVTSKTVGDRVMGMNVTKTLSLPSHYKADQDLLIEIPTKFTFAEVVTLPAVFSTAVYCLINIAKMKRGDTILIHTASGGVGLCAIQLAQQVGADIIATAGSVRKRNFLRNLGIQHVFHSRTTEFGKQILEVTNGKGVDIVLNSITGEGFKEASLGALAKKGRFIEMSKLNVWGHEEVDVLRPDVFYAIVDLTTLKKPDFEKFSETLRQYLSSSTIRPLPYERFDAVNIRGALNYLQKAKHIGKIVCVMPEVKVVNSKFTTTTPLFNPESTYLVTGGLGGIGFEVVKWILRKGGKHVAIASRSAPFPDLESKIQEWNANGAHIQAFSVDVGDYEQCRQLLKSIKSPELGFPPLRGVMHAAGVLSNNLLDNQTWEKFELTYNPKVNGSWNLHDLTKDYLLEHFVLFSSMAATLGSPGQTNHAGSNSFEDGLAHYRHSQGLTATCVNWGNWGEVGVATEIDFPGLRPISTSEGLLALETFLTTQRSHLAVLNIESFAMLCKVFPRIKTYIDDKRLLGESKVKTIISSDEFWAEVDKSEDREGKLLVFKNFIKTVIRNTLKLDADEVIDDHADLQTLGIDSLMSLEMKNAIQNVFGARVSLTAATLKDCNTADILSNRLVDILEGNEETASIPTQEELKLLIREDSCLPEHIKLAINANIKPISEITTVLLTGCTGTLGPYTLRDLSNRPSINKIYCLVRKSGKLTTLERVKKRLQDLKLLDQVNMSKVEYIQGDITSSYFGLAEEDYHKLCEEVDAIIHNAVRADHQAKYWKSPETFKSTVRNVNVKGAVRILEFSLDKTIKHVFYASSLLTVVGVSSEGQHNCEIEQVLIHVAKELGVDIEPVSFEEFVEKLKEEDSNSPLAPFVKEYVDIASTNVRDSEGPMMTACRDFVSSNEAFFQNHKIIQHVPNYNAETESTTDVMRRDLNYLKGLGIFEKFGIVTK